jgi:hypothetical protein
MTDKAEELADKFVAKWMKRRHPVDCVEAVRELSQAIQQALDAQAAEVVAAAGSGKHPGAGRISTAPQRKTVEKARKFAGNGGKMTDTNPFILPVCAKQIGRWLHKKGFEVIYPKNSEPVAKDPVQDEWLLMMDAVAAVICREEAE